ncbi:MAG: LysM peptidoglycan-binding domain-containing protein [Geodermatophilaceae bacterium]|nr:LysM peptidoglycan-binding domain-containing protein [Geodermatophilaceae bacterium]
MLATLERPTSQPISLSPARTPSPSVSTTARLTVVRSAESDPTESCASALSQAGGQRLRQGRPASVLRLTVRARRLLAGLALLCSAAVGVVAIDVLSAVIPVTPNASYADQVAPYSEGDSDGSGGLVPSAGSSVTVAAGDTLWSVAGRVDPDGDPREVIAAIMTINDLSSPTIQPGQVLRLP